MKLFLMLVAALVAGCGKTDNTLKVGTEAAFPPFEYQEGGEIKGFDVDLVKAVCREMGRQVEVQNSDFQGLVPGLKTNKFDMVISCVTITEERKKEVDFSDAYYDAGLIVAVRADEAAIKSKDDLKGRKIGAQENTTGLQVAGTMGGEVKSYPDINLAFQDLANKQIDAVINDEPNSRMIAASKGQFKLVGGLLTSEQYGIVVRKGDAALLAEINKALKKIRESGELDRLKEKWIGKPK